MAAIKERSGKDGDTAGKEGLYRPNPGYSAVVAFGYELGRVVYLEGAEGIEQTPGVEEHEESGEDL